MPLHLLPTASYCTSNPQCFHPWCIQGPRAPLVLGRHSHVVWLSSWSAHWHEPDRRPDRGLQALTSVWVQSRWLSCRGPSCSLHWTEINWKRQKRNGGESMWGSNSNRSPIVSKWLQWRDINPAHSVSWTWSNVARKSRGNLASMSFMVFIKDTEN